MAISWSEDISVGAPVKKSNLSEIKGEIDRIADEVNETLSWDHFVDDGSSSDGDPIDSAIKTEQPQELRDKTDVIYTNRHSTVYGDHDSSFCDADNEGYDSQDYDTADGPYYSSDEGTNYGSDYDPNYSSVDTGNNGTYT